MNRVIIGKHNCLCPIFAAAVQPLIYILKYHPKKCLCHLPQFFLRSIFCKKHNPVSPCVIRWKCVNRLILCPHGMKGFRISDRCHFITGEITPIAPFCIIPVQKILLWHKTNLINNTSANHQGTCCHTVNIQIIRHCAIFQSIIIVNLCTKIFKIYFLPKLLDILRILQVVHLCARHAHLRMVLQKFIEISNSIFIQHGIIIHAHYIGISLLIGSPQPGVKSAGTAEVFFVYKQRHLIWIPLPDLLHRLVCRAVIYHIQIKVFKSGFKNALNTLKNFLFFIIITYNNPYLFHLILRLSLFWIFLKKLPSQRIENTLISSLHTCSYTAASRNSPHQNSFK